MIARGLNIDDFNSWVGIATAIETFQKKGFIETTDKKNNGRTTVTRWFQGCGLIVRIRDKKNHYYLPQVESWEPPKKGNPDYLGYVNGEQVPDSTRSHVSTLATEIRLANKEAICQVVSWRKWFAIEVQYIVNGKLLKPTYIPLNK